MCDNGFIPYWNQIRDDRTNYTYSVDNIVMRGKAFNQPGSDGQQELLDFFRNDLKLVFIHFESGKMGAYHYQFQFQLPDDVGFFVGIGMNTPNGISPFIGLDFNPNKTMHYGDFVRVLNRVLSCCQSMDVIRFDLAVDLPVVRENVFMLKDRRKLSDPNDNVSMDIRNSWANHTSYLGRRSHVGYVKLYNKQLERKLNYPMTRLELTIPPLAMFPEQYLPEVRYFDDLQMIFDELRMTGTDRVLLMACLDNPDLLSMMNKNGKRKKIACILNEYTHKVEVNLNIYSDIISQVKRYCKPFDLSPYEIHPFDNNGGYEVFIEEIKELEL